jgi:hypothetical protein
MHFRSANPATAGVVAPFTIQRAHTWLLGYAHLGESFSTSSYWECKEDMGEKKLWHEGLCQLQRLFGVGYDRMDVKGKAIPVIN